ncbi:hypothetical protein K469DRAFT_693420 [Zopfia rhizophila CBS 207.26]|uniref:Uncharacterized protein n=1 Tax=Zopfia rhizophila CBS 207.26 TaxID=1314779 RepID=A0A6A6DMP3_9PEZI|nr:hypothetical protein K469DRAFT_693420 [Zopfia rhizophila CBS 207.26]
MDALYQYLADLRSESDTMENYLAALRSRLAGLRSEREHREQLANLASSSTSDELLPRLSLPTLRFSIGSYSTNVDDFMNNRLRQVEALQELTCPICRENYDETVHAATQAVYVDICGHQFGRGYIETAAWFTLTSASAGLYFSSIDTGDRAARRPQILQFIRESGVHGGSPGSSPTTATRTLPSQIESTIDLKLELPDALFPESPK